MHVLNIGSCCLHKVHNAFGNALKQLDCDFDQFSIDIYTFSNYLVQGDRIICQQKSFVCVP